MAMAGFDVACWDALAIAAGSRSRAFSAARRNRCPPTTAAASVSWPPDAVADEAEKLVAGGFRAVKLRLGYPTLDAGSRGGARRARRAAGDDRDDGRLQSGAQRCARRSRAGARSTRKAIYWLEEPIRHDDYAGGAALTRELETPVQIGENFSQGARDGGGARGRRRRLCDARPRAHRRRHRLAARRRAGRGAPHRDVVASLSRR